MLPGKLQRLSAVPVVAGLLLATVLLLQACAAYAGASPAAGTVVSGAAPEYCCGALQREPCGEPGEQPQMEDSCASHCAQPARVTSSAVAPGMSFHEPACAAGGGIEAALYSPYRPALAAAPPAIGSTPLIYHLQRLLN